MDRQRREWIVKEARESPLGCGFWTKSCLTMGLYLIWWIAKKLIITNRRIVWRSGIIGKVERSVPLSKVQDVSVSYGILGKLLGYGTVYIETAAGPRAEIVATGITDPDGVREAIMRQIE